MMRTVARSPIRLLTIMILSVFGAELAVMIAIREWSDAQAGWGWGLVDAGSLTILLGPLLYLFLFRPLVSEIARRERASRFLDMLYGTAKALNRATTEGEVVDGALEHLLTVPGVQSGWISLQIGRASCRERV